MQDGPSPSHASNQLPHASPESPSPGLLRSKHLLPSTSTICRPRSAYLASATGKAGWGRAAGGRSVQEGDALLHKDRALLALLEFKLARHKV